MNCIIFIFLGCQPVMNEINGRSSHSSCACGSWLLILLNFVALYMSWNLLLYALKIYLAYCLSKLLGYIPDA
jgi:hypothetical protein